MKVAIMLCGLSREFEKTKEGFKSAFSSYEFDAYMHTWRLDPKVRITSNGGTSDFIEPSPQRLSDAFNLKKICIDNQDPDEIPGFIHNNLENHPNAGLCYFESVRRCFRMIEGEYDVYLVTRPDIFFFEDPNLVIPETGKIYTPRINNLYEGKTILKRGRLQNPGSVFDMTYSAFVYGCRKDVEDFSNFGIHYIKTCLDFPLSGKIDYTADRALAIYMKNVLRKEVVEYPIKHGIQRSSYVQMYSW